VNPPGRTKTLTAYIDGASRGNPGESGFGVLAVEDGSPARSGAGAETDREVELYGYLGRATNNRAEYCALLAALAYARAAGAQVLLVRSDSELMVKQMKGLYRVQNEHLKPLHVEARRTSAPTGWRTSP
jgi:ribonuclease HI